MNNLLSTSKNENKTYIIHVIYSDQMENVFFLKLIFMKNILPFLFTFSALTASAQVPLHSVVEHFTNTKCSICASRNPGFHSNLSAHPQFTHLSIHPSAPYSTCVLSIQNKVDNDDRTNFYGIYGSTPRLVINGGVIPASANYGVASLFSPYTGLTTPISLRIEQTNYGSDSIKAKVVIKKVASTSADARLFIGLVEDTIFVNGGNGETKHYNVLRKSLTGAAPQSVSLAMMPIGDSVTMEMTGTTAAFWDMNRMFAIAILHEDATNKIVQSAVSMPLKTTGIAHQKKVLQFSVAPNPAVNHLKVTVEGEEMVNYKMINMWGASVMEGNMKGSSSINVADLPNACYLLQLSTNEGKLMQQKVLLQR